MQYWRHTLPASVCADLYCIDTESEFTHFSTGVFLAFIHTQFTPTFVVQTFCCPFAFQDDIIRVVSAVFADNLLKSGMFHLKVDSPTQLDFWDSSSYQTLGKINLARFFLNDIPKKRKLWQIMHISVRCYLGMQTPRQKFILVCNGNRMDNWMNCYVKGFSARLTQSFRHACAFVVHEIDVRIPRAYQRFKLHCNQNDIAAKVRVFTGLLHFMQDV
jgi:hypothetical protein